jgi:hypothetical protein
VNDLSFHENKLQNLERGIAELEESFSRLSATTEPFIFAKNMFKLGVANLILYRVRPDNPDMASRGIGQVVCLLVISGRANNRKAAIAAASLKPILAEYANAGGLKKLLADSLQAAGFDYEVDELLALFKRWADQT